MLLENVRKELVWKVVKKAATRHYRHYMLASKDVPDLQPDDKVYFHLDRDDFEVLSYMLHINDSMYAINYKKLLMMLNTYFSCDYRVSEYWVDQWDVWQAQDTLNNMFQNGLDYADIIPYYEACT